VIVGSRLVRARAMPDDPARRGGARSWPAKWPRPALISFARRMVLVVATNIDLSSWLVLWAIGAKGVPPRS